MTESRNAQQRRLESLVGRWKTEGSTIASEGSTAERIDAIDTYEWLADRNALLHLVTRASAI